MSGKAEDVVHEFDQTNGVVEGLEGDSDGTERGDVESKREQARDDFDPTTANVLGGSIAAGRL